MPELPPHPAQGNRPGLRGSAWAVQCLAVGLVCGLSVLAGWRALLTWRSDTALASAQALQLQPEADPAAINGALQHAVTLRPDLADGWQLLARNESFDSPTQARVAAQDAVGLDPTDWNNWQTLAMIDLQLGSMGRARADFAEAAQLESGFAAHYQLGNFDRLLGDTTGFWAQMGPALEMVPIAEAEATLHTVLAADASIGHRELVRHLPRNRPDVVGSAISVLYQTRWFDAALSAWNQLQCQRVGSNFLAWAPGFDSEWAPNCTALTFGLVNALDQEAWSLQTSPTGGTSDPPSNSASPAASVGLITAALGVWNRAAHNRWVPFATAQTGQIIDPDLAPPWPGPAFGWTVNTAQVDSEFTNAGPGLQGLRARFDGQQPDQIELARQWVPVAPGRQYRLHFSSRGMALAAQGGVEVRVFGSSGILQEIPAKLAQDWSANGGDFTAGADTNLVQVEIFYSRPSGQVRLQGEVDIRDVGLDAIPAPATR